MPRVVHFEVHAADPEKAAAFYRAVFGWEITKWDGPAEYWLIRTGPESQRGIDGGLLRRRGPAPAEGQPVSAFVCTVQVDSLDATVAGITAAGRAIVVPPLPVPGIGWLAYATDTQGNIFGVTQSDPQAK